MKVLGIDIGGSGIKGAVVDTEKGELETDRIRLETPQPATPDAVADVVMEVVDHFEWKGPIGVCFPSIIRENVACIASNIDASWIGTNVADVFGKKTGCPVHVINDADAVGLAEIRFGGGKGRKGTILLITVGTGLGTALIIDDKLIPNTELGHLILPKFGEAEKYASDAARKRDDIKWKEWAKRFDVYLKHLEFLFSPDCFVIGGGVSKKSHKFVDRLTVETPVMMAQLKNQAGIIGAAMIGEKAVSNRTE